MVKFCWILYAKWKIWQINFNCFLFGLATLNGIDVVETVTFKTETSLNLRDRDFITNSETETSKFVDFAEIFQKNVVTTSQVEFVSNFSHYSDLFSLFLTCKYNREKTHWITDIFLSHILAIFSLKTIGLWPRPVAFETRPETCETETRKIGPREDSWEWDRDHVSKFHHC